MDGDRLRLSSELDLLNGQSVYRFGSRNSVMAEVDQKVLQNGQSVYRFGSRNGYHLGVPQFMLQTIQCGSSIPVLVPRCWRRCNRKGPRYQKGA
jgi:hypothetical protein